MAYQTVNRCDQAVAGVDHLTNGQFANLIARAQKVFGSWTRGVIDLVRAEVEVVDLTVDSTLQSGALDSLNVMSLIFKIQAQSDILLDEEDADDLRTVSDLAASVAGHIEDQP
jgi:acyl carrier protein